MTGTLQTLIFAFILLCLRIGTAFGNYENLNKYPTGDELVKGEKVKDLKAEDTFSVGYAKYAFAGLFGGAYPPIGFNFGYGGHGYGGGYFSPYPFGYGNPYGGIGLFGSGFGGHHHHHHGFGHGHFGGGYPSFGFNGGINF